VVITNESINRDFRYSIKRHGGMLAKGRLLGIQFATLFTDGLYMQIAQQAIDEAMRIKAALQDKGIGFLIDSPTNQQFPIFCNAQLEELNKTYLFSVWQQIDDTHTAVRICTSWATKHENVDRLIEDIKQL
jgi:threonine aldolase